MILAMIAAARAHCPESPLCWLSGYAGHAAAQAVHHDPRREPDEPGIELERAIQQRRKDTERGLDPESQGAVVGKVDLTTSSKRWPMTERKK